MSRIDDKLDEIGQKLDRLVEIMTMATAYREDKANSSELRQKDEALRKRELAVRERRIEEEERMMGLRE
ncbi:MAG: hypothetical protein IJC31_05960 [Spirochaetaceae bacterium]|nr:hypothetical protein [Spirochaetaceae bacterium]